MKEEISMEKAIVITLAVLIGIAGMLAIGTHLADTAALVLYEPEDDDDDTY